MAIIIVYVLFQNLVMNGLRERVASNEKKIKQLQLQYLEGIQSVNGLEKSYRKYYNLVFVREYLTSKLVFEGEERYLGESITDLSIKHKLKLSNIEFSDSFTDDKHKYILVTNFETDFYTLKNFLNSIDELDKNINLDKMEIDKSGNQLKVLASFSIYISK